ncbi:MAG: MAPEG family protein [Pseudomonadota bacterium]
MLIVTSLTAVPLAILFQYLSLNVIKSRRREGIGIGDGGNEAVIRANRAQGNLLEYSFVFLGLLALAETNGMRWWILAPFAIAFCAGRAMHAFSVLYSETAENGREGLARYVWRIRAMTITLLVIPVMAFLVVASLILPWL